MDFSPPLIIQVSLGAVGAIMSVLFTIAVGELKILRKSVEALNINVAVVIDRVDQHRDRLNRLEQK